MGKISREKCIKNFLCLLKQEEYKKVYEKNEKYCTDIFEKFSLKGKILFGFMKDNNGLCTNGGTRVFIDKFALINPICTEEFLEELVHHEIAHMLAFGEKVEHGTLWRNTFIKIYPKFKTFLDVQNHMENAMYLSPINIGKPYGPVAPKYRMTCRDGCLTFHTRKESIRCYKHNNIWVFKDF